MDLKHLVKQVIRTIDSDAEVVLFGSRARGDFKESSDWDFLILTSRPLTVNLKDEILDKLYDLELRMDVVISAIIHEKKEWERLEVTPLYQLISAEGQRA